ncbi:MAG TPA: CBS domain-containing protein [Gemmatimonadota bacterium]|jgi:CBS domain-containing protein|nr:CBS domain-containing protein [Gemmatimonadota bacterium]
MTMLKDIMTRVVVTVNPATTLRETIEILRAENVNGAPVVQAGQVIGVVSASDILDFEAQTPTIPLERQDAEPWSGFEDEAIHPSTPSFFSDTWEDPGIEVAERFSDEDARDRDALGQHVVGDVMTRGLFALPPDTPLDLAGMYMTRRGIHRVLVMDGMRLVGIASATDFVRAVAQHRI